MSRSLAVALVLVLPAVGAAEGAGWDASFPAAALERHLPGDRQPVLVARAGAADDALTAAATALINALKAAGVGQVLDDTDLGDTTGMTDAELISRAAKLGAKEVLVVRVATDPDGSRRAAVTIHDAQGQQLGAFSAREGQPLDAVDAAPAPPMAPQVDPRAQARFDREQLGFGTFSEPSLLGMVPVDGPFEGSAGRRLSMPEFFEKVGRADLADRYVTRASVRDSLTIGGAAVVVVGLVAAGALLESSASQCSVGTCTTSRSDQLTAALVGGGGAIVGGGLIVGGLLIDPMPVSDAQAKELAKEHNQKLRASLGLSLRAPSPRGGPAISLGVRF